MLAPIILFAFNRLIPLQKTVNSLSNNNLAKESDLIIFVDGYRSEKEKKSVKEVREYVNGLDSGFKTITKHISDRNQGLSYSIIHGIESIIQQYGKAIILEDDLICTPNFLSFMNQALDFYQKDHRIFSICGYGLKIKIPSSYSHDVYLSGRSSSWGWATWRDRWEQVDWDVKDWQTFSHDRKKQKEFNKNGSDMYAMLKAYMEGRNNSWAIRFCYAQFKLKKYSICPFFSKIDNNGFGEQATNCKQTYSRFKVELDSTNKTTFVFPENIMPNQTIDKNCYRYHSLSIRIYCKLRLLLHI